MGLIVPSQDEHALAEGIIRMLDDSTPYLKTREEIAAVFNLERTLDHASTEEFREKKEEYGQKLLNTAITKFEKYGLPTQTRIFVGHKGDDVIRIAGDFDLVAISRRYGDGESTDRSVSPIVLRICQQVKTPAIIY